MAMELVVNDPKEGWSNAKDITVSSVAQALQKISEFKSKNPKLQFGLTVDGKSFMFKGGKFFSTSSGKPLEMSAPSDGPDAFSKEVEKRMKRLGAVDHGSPVKKFNYKGYVVEIYKGSSGNFGYLITSPKGGYKSNSQDMDSQEKIEKQAKVRIDASESSDPKYAF